MTTKWPERPPVGPFYAASDLHHESKPREPIHKEESDPNRKYNLQTESTKRKVNLLKESSLFGDFNKFRELFSMRFVLPLDES